MGLHHPENERRPTSATSIIVARESKGGMNMMYKHPLLPLPPGTYHTWYGDACSRQDTGAVLPLLIALTQVVVVSRRTVRKHFQNCKKNWILLVCMCGCVACLAHLSTHRLQVKWGYWVAIGPIICRRSVFVFRRDVDGSSSTGTRSVWLVVSCKECTRYPDKGGRNLFPIVSAFGAWAARNMVLKKYVQRKVLPHYWKECSISPGFLNCTTTQTFSISPEAQCWAHLSSAQLESITGDPHEINRIRVHRQW